MYSKWREKTYICLIILGQLKAFQNYKGFSIIFPKIFAPIQSFKKVRILLIPLSIAFSIQKILRCLYGNLITTNGTDLGEK